MPITCSTDLSETELEYAFLNAMGFSVIGSRDGPFALYDQLEKSIVVFGADKPESIRQKSFDADLSQLPFEYAKSLGATFTVEGDLVYCHIDEVKSSGNSYCQAAMRALISHKTHHVK